MPRPPQERRRAEIEGAAYAVLAEHGLAGTTMLAVARRAKASNETLYAWYGDRLGLFRALIRENAAASRALIVAEAEGARNPLEVLRDLGSTLLGMLLGERAVALNRAAAADATGELGRVLAEAGRSDVLPLLARLLARAAAEGRVGPGDPDAMAALFIDLLVGDLQVRRVTGAMPEPPPSAWIAERAERAVTLIQRLCSPDA